MSLKIHRIPAFRDNYFWLFHQDGASGATVVDPGDAEPVLRALATLGLQLDAILATHHHPDHIGGIPALSNLGQIPVYGPYSNKIPFVTHPLADGDRVEFGGLVFQVIAVPGHTLDHLAYYMSTDIDRPVVFCGDTLFAGGCGRLFEGTPQQMLESLKKIASLDSRTLIYCAHEYTQANLEFASVVEPGNTALTQRRRQVDLLRANGTPTIPTDLATELKTNPFLRCNLPEVIRSAKLRDGSTNFDASEANVFRVIRSWKDKFQPGSRPP